MNQANHPIFFASIMLIAGLGIPIMAALNGALAGKLQSVAFATVILFAVGLVFALIFLLAGEGIPTIAPGVDIPKIYFFGGIFIIFYVFSVSWVGPKFGVGNAISFVLLGQLISMMVIDHFALFNAPYYAISTQRIIGLLLMTAGVFLVVRKTA